MSYDRQASIESYRTHLIQLAEDFCLGKDVWEEFGVIAEVLQLEHDAKERLHQKGYDHSGLNILKTVELVPAR